MILLVVLLMAVVFSTLLLTRKLQKYWFFVLIPLFAPFIIQSILSTFNGLKSFFTADVLPRTCSGLDYSVCAEDGGQNFMTLPRLLMAMFLLGAILFTIFYIYVNRKTPDGDNDEEQIIKSPTVNEQQGFHFPKDDEHPKDNKTNTTEPFSEK